MKLITKISDESCFCNIFSGHRYDFSSRGENIARTLNQLEKTEEEKGHEIVARKRDSSISVENVDEITTKRVTKRFSFRGHTENGRRRYQMSDKNESFSNETRI